MSAPVFAVLGLGTMGRNIALNIEEKGYHVAVWNRTWERTETFLEEHFEASVTGARTIAEVVELLSPPRRILLMVPAGPPVEEVLNALLPLLQPGDVVVDGGNSHFERTEQRAARFEAAGVHYLGLGVSGGESGARHGPSLMAGGSREAWQLTRQVLEAVAARSEEGVCAAHFGPGGAGHFVKMVHNGIEYAVMQLIAETYDMLHRGGGLSGEGLAELFEAWNEGELESFLVEITAAIFRVVDDETGQPLVERVLDRAGQKGTGRWAVAAAAERGVAVPTIAAAVDARILSNRKENRSEIEELAGSPSAGLPPAARKDFPEEARRALYASILCAYAQGIGLIRQESEARDWRVPLPEVARVWTGGCILRARLLTQLHRALQENEEIDTLLRDEWFSRTLLNLVPTWRRVVALGVESGIPVAAHAASLSWFESLRTSRLPQNLTQAQRDAFGSHTYERTDRPGEPLHTDWLGDAD